jgi:three-Cys-motif partner protein
MSTPPSKVKVAKQTAQVFGAHHTIEKLHAFENYIKPYAIALGNKFPLHYIDAFAGSGKLLINEGGEQKEIRSSVEIAIQFQEKFQDLYFIDASKENCNSLIVSIAQKEIGDRFKVYNRDANEILPQLLSKLPKSDAKLVFLDPFGMEVKWKTLVKISKIPHVDVLYLFSLSGLYREIPKNHEKLSPGNEKMLNEFLGTEEWKNFYTQSPQKSLFSNDPEYKRECEWQDMLAWVQKRMETIFSYVYQNPKILFSGKNVPYFALFAMLTSKSPQAHALAARLLQSALR